MPGGCEMILNTCLECGRVFDSNIQRDFCSYFCRKKHSTKKQTSEKQTPARVTVLSFFEDVII
jgi:hypothetical protein